MSVALKKHNVVDIFFCDFFFPFLYVQKIQCNQNLNTHTCSFLNTTTKYIYIDMYKPNMYIYIRKCRRKHIHAHAYIYIHIKRKRNPPQYHPSLYPTLLLLCRFIKSWFFLFVSDKILRHSFFHSVSFISKSSTFIPII